MGAKNAFGAAALQAPWHVPGRLVVSAIVKADTFVMRTVI